MANLGRFLLTVAVFTVVRGVYSRFGGHSDEHGDSSASPKSKTDVNAEDPTRRFIATGEHTARR
jgi:hypothetical protein